MRLLLMRHAKSDWDDPRLTDKERPLNPRGRRSAAALGGWLRDADLVPDLALVSGAVRTRETWELLGLEAPVAFLDTLYLAGPSRIFEVVTREGGSAATLLVIGHNPGIGELAARLAGTEAATFPELSDYPTGATTILDYPGPDWASPGRPRLEGFVMPRQLLQDEDAD